MASVEEFRKLQREYQFLEQNRKDYAKESSQTIARQEKLLDKLRRDNAYLKSEYRNHIKKPRGNTEQEKLQQLQDQVDMYAQKVQLERANNEELAKEISLKKQQVRKVRREMGGINAAKENNELILKQVKILENRLHKALIKFNEALSYNKDLREQIDNLRKERVVFDNIYKKLENKLHNKKKQMSQIIEESNKAYEARDGIQMQIAEYQHKDLQEHKIFEEKMAQYDRRLMRRPEESDPDAPTRRGKLTVDEENALRQDVTKAAWVLMKDKANIQVSKEKVKTYQEALEEIKEKTGIDKIDVMVKKFIAQEDKNFSLFNYVNSQTHEIEKLEDEIAQLEEEKKRFSEEATGDGTGQRNHLHTDLHRRLTSIKTSTETYDANFQDLEKMMASLKVGIQHIFNKIGCDVSAMSDMLADSHVTEVNMMQYLGIIEQRTNEILQAWAIYKSQHENNAGAADGDDNESKDEEEKAPSPTFKISSVIGQGPAHPMGDQKIQIAPPAMEEYASGDEDSDDEDDVQMPQSLDSIIADVKKYMGRRESSTATTRKQGGKKK
eukprot:INCI6104.1.p1 GENE.INCI6104.1~~INCI6104.1.p1  ORF type:complete len:553 (+),score=154.84 INCI6104.1:246-1904(+)